MFQIFGEMRIVILIKPLTVKKILQLSFIYKFGKGDFIINSRHLCWNHVVYTLHRKINEDQKSYLCSSAGIANAVSIYRQTKSKHFLNNLTLVVNEPFLEQVCNHVFLRLVHSSLAGFLCTFDNICFEHQFVVVFSKYWLLIVSGFIIHVSVSFSLWVSLRIWQVMRRAGRDVNWNACSAEETCNFEEKEKSRQMRDRFRIRIWHPHVTQLA